MLNPSRGMDAARESGAVMAHRDMVFFWVCVGTLVAMVIFAIRSLVEHPARRRAAGLSGSEDKMGKLLRRVHGASRRPKPTKMWATGVPPQVWVQGPEAAEQWKALVEAGAREMAKAGVSGKNLLAAYEKAPETPNS